MHSRGFRRREIQRPQTVQMRCLHPDLAFKLSIILYSATPQTDCLPDGTCESNFALSTHTKNRILEGKTPSLTIFCFLNSCRYELSVRFLIFPQKSHKLTSRKGGDGGRQPPCTRSTFTSAAVEGSNVIVYIISSFYNGGSHYTCSVIKR